ncbi:MAG: class I SAM-dependent methyltransferase [Planctomycetes bacterium]|nr:class I SAM-dependent methyltransferase [Planctomycetota bacterium]
MNERAIPVRRDRVSFPERQDRMRYLARTFGSRIRGRVLDVGCDVCTLRELIPGLEYTGIDLGGTPDLRIDLDATPRLPFADASFDVVVCSEVLEHLDQLHRAFGELVRVTRGELLISLPNCWHSARKPLRTGRGKIGHYGLPARRPEDRHRWFFSLAEARAFAAAQAQEHGLAIEELRVNEKPRGALVRGCRRLLHPRPEAYDNLYAHTLWVRFRKLSTPRSAAGDAPDPARGA